MNKSSDTKCLESSFTTGQRDEVAGEWRRMYNLELNDLFSLPNIVRLIKSRRMRWAGHMARLVRGEVCKDSSKET